MEYHITVCTAGSYKKAPIVNQGYCITTLILMTYKVIAYLL